MKRWEPIAFPGPGGVHRNFNESTGESGSRPDGRGYQQVIDELSSLSAKAGLAASEVDSLQILKATRGQYLNFAAPAAVAGSAAAITLAFDPSYASLAALIAVPLRFTLEADIPGAATIAVDGLAAVDLTWPDGTVLAPGDGKAGSLIEVSYDGTAFRLRFCLSPTQVRALVTNPNLLVNGDFQINQRAFAGGALANGVYGYDRWKANGASNLAVAGYTLNIATGGVHQIVEPGFWGYGSFASTKMTVSVEDPSQDLTIALGSVGGTIAAGAGRRSVTLTTGAGDNGNLSLKIARSGGGAVSFGRVKLEVGGAATAWRARPAWQEASLAYRYFWKFIAPYADARLCDAGSLQDSGLFTINLYLPTEMRATPSVSWANLSRKVSSNSPLLSLSSLALHKHSLALAFTSAALAAGTVYPASLVSTVTGGHLTVDAEL